jgi:tetratricopeptide (TPR) repeat protein/predicted Ser/Thr protein kinase
VTGDTFEKAEQLFLQAMQRPKTERAAFVRAGADGDAELEAMVRSLLEANDDIPAWMRTESIEQHVSLAVEKPAPDDPAPVIDGITITRVLGVGGMGIVYHGVQAQPPRPVAIKVLKQHGFGERSARLMQREVTALSRLQHPSIAHLYSVGVETSGQTERPYFLMEYVDGVRLDEWRAQSGDDVEKSIRLLMAVAEAVSYAHTRGVIHRDLKPGNVLVDANDQPHILDFGIAGVVESELGGAGDWTETIDKGIGTAPYMAPEQFTEDAESHSTSVDIYALGVLGFRLLTGEAPQAGLDTATLGQLVKRVTLDPARTPSSLNASLARDIDAILLRALEKDPEDRYQSARELAEDLNRFLRHEPVKARRGGALYYGRKFARRNPVLCGTIAGAVMLLIAAVIVSAGFAAQSRQAERVAVAARDEAEIESRRRLETINDLEATVSFLERIFQAPDPWVNDVALAAATPGDVRLIDALEWASDHVGDEMTDRPAVAGRLRSVLAETFQRIGKFDAARHEAERIVALLEESDSLDDSYVVELQANAGTTFLRTDDTEQAAALLRDAFESAQSLTDIDPALVVGTGNSLVATLWQLQDFEGAATMGSEVVQYANERLDPLHGETLIAEGNLATILPQVDRLDDAVALTRAVLAKYDAADRAMDPDALTFRSNLSQWVLAQGKTQEALEIMYEVIAARETVLGESHLHTVGAMWSVAKMERLQAEDEQAESLLQSAIDRAAANPDLPTRVADGLRLDLADCLASTGRREEALGLLVDYRADLATAPGSDPDRLARLDQKIGEIGSLAR